MKKYRSIGEVMYGLRIKLASWILGDISYTNNMQLQSWHKRIENSYFNNSSVEVNGSLDIIGCIFTNCEQAVTAKGR